VAPIYPVIDEQAFRLEFQSYYQNTLVDDPLWPLLLGMVLLLGSLHADSGDSPGFDLKRWQRNEMLKVVSSAHLLYMRSSLRSVQVLLLTASH
jgi:hypothetical protein